MQCTCATDRSTASIDLHVRRPHGDLRQTQAARLAEWSTARLKEDGEQATDVERLDGRCPDVRSVTPDVDAGDTGKLAAPVACERKGAQQRHELVAAMECSVEKIEAISPDAVDRFRIVRLAENIMELNLRRHMQNRISVTERLLWQVFEKG